MANKQATTSKKISVGLVISRSFGILFALTGISTIFSDPIPGIVMLIMAAVLIPNIRKLAEEKWKFYLSKGIKIGIIFVGLIIFWATIDTSDISTNQQIEAQKEETEIVNNETRKPNTNNQINQEQITETDNKEKENVVVTSDKEEVTVENQTVETLSQKNAIRKAKSYLNIAGFSRDWLIKQLEFEKFSNEDATYAVDNIWTDRNKQAERKAQSYLNISWFSRDGLIKQLEFDGFTNEQAAYGVNAVGL